MCTENRKGSCWLRLFFGLLFCFLVSVSASSRAEVNPTPYDRVIIIGVDAAGTKFRQADTPNFDRIFSGGVITDDARSTLPTVSAPSWGAVFYGVPAIVHGTSNTIAESYSKTNELYDSIFKITRKAYPRAKVASFAKWTAINRGLIEQDCGIYLFPEDKKSTSTNQIIQKAAAYLENNDPRLMFVYIGDLDSALHKYGYGSQPYMEKASAVDARIGILYDALEKKGLLENTLILFVTDHGGNGTTHGGDSDDETRVTFAAAGPRLETNGSVEDMELQDVAAIVLYALGIEQPENQTGRVPKGIFQGEGGTEREESPLIGRFSRYGAGPSRTEPEKPDLSASLSEKLVYYQDFDGRVEGLTRIKILSAGFTGSAMNLRISYLKTEIKNNPKWTGMTIGFWFKAEEDFIDPVFVTDKNWKLGINRGFAIAKCYDAIQVNIGGGKKFRKDLLWNLPQPQYPGKWIHCLVVFDQPTQTVSLYCDFALVGKAKALPSKYSYWASGEAITAGQDITGNYRYRMNAEMDELMIFNKALTAEEIDELRVWYERYFTAAANTPEPSDGAH